MAQVAEAVLRLAGEQLCDEIDRLIRKVMRELVLHARHLPIHLHLRRAAKRRVALDHLEGEHADRPPIEGGAVAAVEDHLGREVVRRAAERVRLLAAAEALREAHVDQLEVARRREE